MNLNNHFKSSGYSIHRIMLKKQRLPKCCQEHLVSTDSGIRYLNSKGFEVVLKLEVCSECGRKFAVSDGKYMPVDNLLKFDVVKLEK